MRANDIEVLHSICQQIWKTQPWTQGWKRSVFIPLLKTMPKNVQIIRQLCSFHMLVRLYSKYFKLGFNSMWTDNFYMYKLGLKRQRNQKSNCQHSLDHSESKRIPEKVSTSKPLCGSMGAAWHPTSLPRAKGREPWGREEREGSPALLPLSCPQAPGRTSPRRL